ncbi:MAG: ribosome-binding factor A [bacterium]|nr:ribosome-binding factor A [bacterium]
MDDAHRSTKISEEIQRHAADFLARVSNRTSLITVTSAELSVNQKQATIYFTVLPESEEAPALAFTKRKRNDFRIYIRRHSKIGPLPIIDFEIDVGEKNRQRIDDLTRT